MHSDQQFYHRKAASPPANQVGNRYVDIPVASAYGAALPPPAKHSIPFHGVEFQTSEVCPRNFIIFDQTEHKSQIMFHPANALKFGGPGFDVHATYVQETFEKEEVKNMKRMTSSLVEDSADIDLLLSLEEGEHEDYDEEEVSTARTDANHGSDSSEFCSTYGSRPWRDGSSSSVQKSSDSSQSERKRQKMKKMVKTLRGIVPGGDQMNTVTVLDEAVRYLKSLKVEAQKLGVGSFNN
ncbi:transcription factor bHLH [Tripterygium wilfordii]|uniref:Transcription factor bHLH n=1 Tax=Tripterygium wilfordii TaxID=458696 RepID=A0A7J7CW44_TRIWF|nr:transcription factor bHLH144-like [Tripterygium wilfordii]KAF5738310.1 transcription factor bHLH [Tripterygium wilfordii]